MSAGEHVVAEACALVPRILAAEDVGGWTVTRAFLTSTRIVVVTLAGVDGRDAAVVKLPTTQEAAAALSRESVTLGELHGDERLDGWRALVPEVYASGEVLGQRYRIERALPGEPFGADMRDAADAIGRLHRATAERVAVGERLAEEWVDARLDAAFGSRSRTAGRSELRSELRAALDGRELVASRTHGDYWSGNILFSPDGEAVTGIVDWDAATALDLPAHDILHLLLYTRRLRTGEELGQIIRSRLRGEPWSDEERDLLDRYCAWSHPDSLSARHVLLLYWLRHVALHLSQQGRGGGMRRRVWQTRNVHLVMGGL